MFAYTHWEIQFKIYILLKHNKAYPNLISNEHQKRHEPFNPSTMLQTYVETLISYVFVVQERWDTMYPWFTETYK